jgi:hypothetical protein
VPRGAAPRALLGVLALIIAIAVAIVPVVEARPKDKIGKQDRGSVEIDAGNEANQTDGSAPGADPVVTDTGDGSSNERTLLALDADGDYLPDALDNCPTVQNPDQADADGDGHGDACPVYQDTDGDGVPDKEDNCPTLATSDFADPDGDGIGTPCDKSPDGIEPETEPLPELNGGATEAAAEPPPAENGENLDGTAVERPGRDRTRERSRTESSDPVITMGADTEDVPPEETMEGTGGQPVEEVVYEEPVRDNPRRNEELIAEAAAAGEIYDPAPPPEPSRAWEEEVQIANWDTVVRIDAGATDDAIPGDQNDGGSSNPVSLEQTASATSERRNRTEEVRDSEFARGWVRAKLLLQEELAQSEGDPSGVEQPAASDILEYRQSDDDIGEPAPTDEALADGQPDGGFAPVPVENGLVIMGAGTSEEQSGETTDAAIEEAEPGDAGNGAEPATDEESLDDPDLLDEAAPGREESDPQSERAQEDGDRAERRTQKDDSRRNGSARGVAATQTRQQTTAAAPDDEPDAAPDDPEPNDTGRRDRADRNSGTPDGWSDDRFYAGGSALNWSGDIGVAGTDDDPLYLTRFRLHHPRRGERRLHGASLLCRAVLGRSGRARRGRRPAGLLRGGRG